MSTFHVNHMRFSPSTLVGRGSLFYSETYSIIANSIQSGLLGYMFWKMIKPVDSLSQRLNNRLGRPSSLVTLAVRYPLTKSPHHDPVFFPLPDRRLIKLSDLRFKDNQLEGPLSCHVFDKLYGSYI
jgi:hypothetical protein